MPRALGSATATHVGDMSSRDYSHTGRVQQTTISLRQSTVSKRNFLIRKVDFSEPKMSLVHNLVNQQRQYPTILTDPSYKPTISPPECAYISHPLVAAPSMFATPRIPNCQPNLPLPQTQNRLTKTTDLEEKIQPRSPSPCQDLYSSTSHPAPLCPSSCHAAFWPPLHPISQTPSLSSVQL